MEGRVRQVRATSMEFEDFVAENGQHLFRLGLLVTGNRADAEDAVQEALARALRQWDRVSAAGDPHAYVRRMVTNQAVSHWRSTRRIHVHDDPTSLDPHRHAAAAENVPDNVVLWQACEALPAKLRAAVVLRFYEDMTYAEIAETLGCREGTARVRVARALAQIRSQLDEGGSR